MMKTSQAPDWSACTVLLQHSKVCAFSHDVHSVTITALRKCLTHQTNDMLMQYATRPYAMLKKPWRSTGTQPQIQ